MLKTTSISQSRSRRRKRKAKQAWGCSVILLLLLAGIGTLVFWQLSRSSMPFSKEPRALPVLLPAPTLDPPTLPEPELESAHAILLDAESEEVLFEKASRERTWPASLTKMMTVLLSIELLPDLNEEILLPDSVFRGLYEADASMAGFSPGEKVKAIDLLYGAMLPSGAECVIGLSERLAGSESKFVELMNQRAKELHLSGTHFVNSSGLHDPEHYSTAEDMAKLLQAALKNPTFRSIFTSQTHLTSPTNLHPAGLSLQSTVFRKLSDPSFAGGRFLGGKTGYTGEAGLCLATLALQKGSEYLFVSTAAPGASFGVPPTIRDAISVYEKGDQYKRFHAAFSQN